MSPLKSAAIVPMMFANQTEADRFYLAEAFRERAMSDDPKRTIADQAAVGAVIAGKAGEISRSANIVPPRVKAGMARGQRKVREEDRYFVLEHAERAALFKAWEAKADLSSMTLYCTRFPCSDCARAIAWSPIRRVVFPTGFAGERHWLPAQRAALQILRDAGITVRYLGSPGMQDIEKME